jgi:PAS domain S-box-containing protein
MLAAIPRESFPGEKRVAIVPKDVAALKKAGLELLIESGAGQAALHADADYEAQGALIAVDHRGYITAFNPAAAVMLGHNTAKVLQSPMQYTLFGAEGLVQILQQTLNDGQAQAHQEIVVKHWDGTQLPIAVSVAPLTGGDEQHVLGVVGVLEDLSEIKTLEAERRRLDRLAALGEMSAVVAHEIRNPVAGIAAGIEYLTRNISEDSPDFEGAKMIQGEVVRVNRILEDILFVARPLQLNVAAENLAMIIEGVLQRCQAQIASSQLEISSSYAPDLPLIKADRQRLEQVFSNLIINATQAMHGEKLTLYTKLAPPRNGRPADTIIVTIEDTGPGIPAEIHRRIFDPFFTTKARGTGLGLTVARRIIEEHRGSIQIEGEREHGTRFVITLPIAQEGDS